MEITKVAINKTSDGTVKAIVSIVIDDCFIIKDLKVINGKNGIFVAMPSKETREGFEDIAHPVNRETHNIITKAVLDQYNDGNR